MKKEVVVIIHNVRSASNVGSIFRTADGAGVNKIYLTGYTPAPLDRFGRVNKKLADSALGAENFVAWKAVPDLLKLLKKLKANKATQLIALEQAPNSIDYKKVKIRNESAVIVGSEIGGVPKNILDKMDVVAEIPMKGKKESLNVAVAFGIFVYSLL